MSKHNQELSPIAPTAGGDVTVASWARAVGVATIARLTRHSRLASALQEQRTLRKFHALGQAIISGGGNVARPAGVRWAYARVGTGERANGTMLRVYVAEISGQLAGNAFCPDIRDRHEMHITALDLNTGEALPGYAFAERHEGHYLWDPVGGVVAAPIIDGAVHGPDWCQQRPQDIAPLGDLLGNVQWGDTVAIDYLGKDALGPRYV